jgi:hypothetical protein
MKGERSVMGGLMALLLTVAIESLAAEAPGSSLAERRRASAQEVTGNIYGRILDPSNAVMPGVTVTVHYLIPF